MNQDLKNLYNLIVRFIYNYKFLILILLVSFFVKLDYVFYGTHYRHYLVSDMGVYMNRAEQRFNGDLFSVFNWTGWSTFFSFYLTFFFKILYFFGLYEKRLEAILFFNVLYSTLSIIFVYLIAKKIISDKRFVYLVTIFYALSFQLFYLNAFVLSENIAIPLLILSSYLTLLHSDSKKYTLLSGLCMGLVASFRPALNLIAVPSFIYILLSKKIFPRGFVRASLFAVGFVLVTFMTCVENCYISKGELRGLSSLGGLHFFFEQCKVSFAHSTATDKSISIAPTVFISLYKNDQKKLEEGLHTDRPLHDEKYFYGLANECIKKNPKVWIENFLLLKYLFIGDTFPFSSDARWIISLNEFSKKIILFMSIAIAVLFFKLRKNNVVTKEILFLISIPLSIAIICYFFLPDQRWLLPSYFVIYTIFFYLLSKTNYYKNSLIVILSFFCLLFIKFF